MCFSNTLPLFDMTHYVGITFCSIFLLNYPFKLSIQSPFFLSTRIPPYLISSHLTSSYFIFANSTVNRTLGAEVMHHFQLCLDLVDDAPGGGSVSSVATHTGFNRSWAAGCWHSVLPHATLVLWEEEKKKEWRKERKTDRQREEERKTERKQPVWCDNAPVHTLRFGGSVCHNTLIIYFFFWDRDPQKTDLKGKGAVCSNVSKQLSKTVLW